VLRRRDAIQMEYDMLLEELCRKKDDKDEVAWLFYDIEYCVSTVEISITLNTCLC